jgi:hypothetical protein
MKDEPRYTFGQRDEWRVFEKEHPIFLERLPALDETIHRIVARQNAHIPKPVDRVMITLGWVCANDFSEIIVLCGNGMGIGGLKLLRGLYERAVTAQFLSAFPDQVDKFFDYNAIHLGKLYGHIQKPFQLIDKLSPEYIEQIKSARKIAEERFKEPVCQECGTSRTQMSWSANDVLSMAITARKKLGFAENDGLDALYGICYFMPTLHTHPTFFSFKDWVEFSETSMEWKTDAERRVVDHAMPAAHFVMLHVLRTQNDYFGLGLDEEIELRQKDFVASWPSTDDAASV